MKATDFDKRFDDGGKVTDCLDLKKALRPGLQHRRVNVDCPSWMVSSIDREAQRLGVTRQSLIKLWLSERLER